MSYILYTNVFVALCAASLVTATRALLGGGVQVGVLELHVWFATMTVYNIDRLVDEDDLLHASERHRWIADRRRFLWGLTALSAVGTVASMVFLPARVVVGLAGLAVISFLYSVPIFGADFRLKKVPGAKTFVIGLVWTMVTVVLPALELHVDMPWLAVAERFAFVFAITLPFELRDMRRDRAAGVASIAHALGAKGSTALSVALLLGAAALSVLRWTGLVGWAGAGAYLATALVCAAAVRSRPDWFYSFVVDGTMLAWAVAVLVAI